MTSENRVIVPSDSILYQYFNIIDATNIVSKTDVHGVITYANKKFLEISGYTLSELLGNHHNILRDPEIDTALFKDMWSTIKSKNIWHGIITNLKKDGEKYTVKASIFPILNEDQEIIEYIAIRHDITEILELNTKVKDLHNYNVEQEYIAREKLEAGIVNDMSKDECKILYHPSDILSGDFYSIYKREDGSIFIYMMDGQGHGISPALTVFAISSMMNKVIYNIHNFDELIEQLAPTIKHFLGEIEQLSYSMIMISPDKRKISYASAGMYPFLIKSDTETIKIKANNTPFMNFSETPNITTVEVGKWDSLLIYSDGLVEHENSEIKKFLPEELIHQESLIEQVMDKIKKCKFDDDVSLLYAKNIA